MADAKFGEVRSLLARGASEEHFARVCALWPRGDVPEEIVEYVRGVVSRWPEHIPCAVPEVWVDVIEKGKGLDRPCSGLAMCKTLVVRGGFRGFAQDADAWSKREELTGLHRLEIDGRGMRRTLPPALCRQPTFSRVEHLVLKHIDNLGKLLDDFLSSALSRGLKHLHLEDVALDPEQCERLVMAPDWSGLESLTCSGVKLGTALYTLCKREDLMHLRSLSLGKQTISHHGISAIAALAERTDALRRLSFWDVSLSESSVAILATHRAFSSLEHLGLSRGELSLASIQALARSYTLSSLESLALSLNPLGDDIIQALARAPMCVGLTELRLSFCRLGNEGVEALANSLYLSNLSTLDLSFNAIGDDAMVSLAVSDVFEGLCELDLRGCRIGDEGIVALTQASFFDNLESLHLHDNDFKERGRYALWAKGRGLQGRQACLQHMTLTGDGLEEMRELPEVNAPYSLWINRCRAEPSFWEALTRSPRFKRLRTLEIEYTPLCEGAMETLSGWGVLARMERLAFRGVNMTTRDLRVLCGTAALDRLEHLEVMYANLEEEGIEVLLEWEGLARLRTLDIKGSMLSARMIDALLSSAHTPCLRKLVCKHSRASSGMAHHLKKRAAARGIELEIEHPEVMMDIFPVEISRGGLAWSEPEDEEIF